MSQGRHSMNSHSTTTISNKSTSSGADEETIDKLKARYRIEALAAVEEAEKKGFEKGKQEAMKIANEQVNQWKAVAEAVASSAHGKSEPESLLKYIMEQIYKDAKNDFGTGEVLSKIKVIIWNYYLHTVSNIT